VNDSQRLRSMWLAMAALAVLLLSPFAQGDEPMSVRSTLSGGAVYLGDSLILVVEVKNSEPDRNPEFPDAQRAGYRAEFLRRQNKSFTSTVIINGQISESSVVSYELLYRIVPLRVGEHEIPELEIRAGDQVQRTQPVTFRVIGPSEREDMRVRISTSDRSPYAGQPITVDLEVLIQRGSNINNVSFDMPGLEDGFTIRADERVARRRSGTSFEFLGSPTDARVDQVTEDGQQYDRIRASRTIVPTAPGETTVGPAVWICDFTPPRARRSARVAVPSNELTITVRDLPQEGRPSDFTGLIGEYRVRAEASPTRVRVGDPIRFDLTLEGPGDLRRVPVPEIAGMRGFDAGFRLAAREPERQFGDGAVTFRYVVRAIADVVDAVPGVVLNYFDPVLGEYALMETDPIPLEVAPSRVVTAVDGEAFSAPATEAQRVESAPRTLSANRSGRALLEGPGFSLASAVRSPVVIALVATPPAAYFALLGVMAVRRHRGRGVQAVDVIPGAKRAWAQLKRDESEHAPAIRNAFVLYASLRRAEPMEVLTPSDAIETIRADRADLAGRADEILRVCESERFGGGTGACTAETRTKALELLRELGHPGPKNGGSR